MDTIAKVKTIEAKATDEEKADLSAGKTTINKVSAGIKEEDEKIKTGRLLLRGPPASFFGA